MELLGPLPLRTLFPRLCCRRRLATLGILLGCLPVAAALAVVADRVLEASRRTRGGVEGNPIPSNPMTPAMSVKMGRQFQASAGRRPGFAAPDFTLPDSSGKPVTLSNFRGKRPVVLVFGSFGCDLFCEALGGLRRLRDAWKGRAEFLFVYVSEGPHDSTPLPRAARPIPPPAGKGARLRRVRWYEEEAGGNLCWLLDGEDERVEELYSACPRRLVIVGVDGRVAFDAGHTLSKPWDMGEIERQLRAVAPRGPLH
jgi:hypothetical protein